MVSIYSGFPSATFYVVIPHAAGAAVTAVDGTFRVLPDAPSGMPLAPFDSTGWTASVSETTMPLWGEVSQISLLADTDPLGEQVCPVPYSGTDPPPPESIPPVFLARLTGTTGRGPFRSEAYASMCTRTTIP
jgi:hypothetical protein